jgi:DNA repair protein RadC
MEQYKPNLSITSWAEEDRPREKLMLKGRSALTDAELIAILIGSGNPKQSAVDLSKVILNSVQNNLNELAGLSVKGLMKFHGIGEAKAISIIAALELGRRRKTEDRIKKPKLNTSKDSFKLLYPLMADKITEEFWIVLLNQNNKVLSKHLISTGGIAGTVADVRIILKLAIDELAASIVLSHNHPSGSVKPSHQDKVLTHKIVESASIMEIKVVDHIIIGDEDYFSFADEQILI